MAFAVNLPAVNGTFEVGLAAASEAALEDAKKLCICAPDKQPDGSTLAKDLQFQMNFAMVDQYLKAKDAALSAEKILLLMSGAAVAVVGGLLRWSLKADGTRDTADGDWMVVPESNVDIKKIDQACKDACAVALEPANLSTAATMIAATKVNWWKENHHVGAGAMSGYVSKVASQKFANPADMKDVIHRIGHWCSTRHCLTSLGVKDIQLTEEVLKTRPDAGLKAAADVVLRIESNPAGTARHFIALALVKRMITSAVIVYCPSIGDFAGLAAECATIMKHPARYHIGAEYLADYKVKFADTDASAFLGRAGTWGHAFIPGSTLMKSPHAIGYKNADDFSADYESAITAYQVTVAKAGAGVVVALGAGDMTLEYQDVSKAFNVKPNPKVIDAFKELAKKQPAAGTSSAPP